MTFGAEIIDLFQGIDLEADQALDRYTSFRVGGPADLLARPKTVRELVSLVDTAKYNKIPVTILGGGTNTLISDKGVRGLVILLTALKSGPRMVQTGSPSLVMALAGERLSTLGRFAMNQGLSGLEWAAGIPGTVGGALMMNAGAHGSDMAKVIISADILAKDGIRTVHVPDLDFGYRKLNLNDGILVNAVIALTPADPDLITATYQKNLAVKRASQPVSKASGGCFFKNPSPDRPAGYLIEQAGLKGYAYKGAMVSDLHANFIINHDNARCQDILALARVVRDRVYDKFGVRLESEVKTIGE